MAVLPESWGRTSRAGGLFPVVSRKLAGMGLSRLVLLARGHCPTVVIDIEDDAVGVLEFALETFFAFFAEIEEELASGALDRGLAFFEVIDLKTEVMNADETGGIFEPGSRLALVLQQGQIDFTVAHIDAARGRPFRQF